MAAGLGEGPLAKYSRPPVSEVAVGIEFAPIVALSALHLVRFSEQVRSELPNVVEQHPLPPSPPLPGSLLGGFGPAGAAFQIGLLATDRPALRLWMLSEDTNTLLQLQNDRIVLNWRRETENASYPSYSTLSWTFAKYWQAFGQYLITANLPAAKPLVAEVTFVNVLGRALEPSALDRVLATVSSTEALGKLTGASVEYRADVSRDRGAGQCVIRIGADDSNPDGAMLTTTTRVAVERDALTYETFSEDLDFAHDVGVRAFRAVTREERQILDWGRTE